MPKNRTSTAWYQYQDKVRDLFRSLGCEAEANVEVVGVRGKHVVDVYVKLRQLGINTTWVIECKYWKTNIPKEKVLALQSMVADVGADKGFLFSERGFQSGAVAAARRTNIILTSIDEVQREAAQELRLLRIRKCADAVDEMVHAMYNLPRKQRQNHGNIEGSGISSVDAPPDYFMLLGRLVIFEMELKAARRGKEKAFVVDADDEGPSRLEDSLDTYIGRVQEFLREAEAFIVKHQDWKPQG